MKQIISYIEYLRTKPHHVRRRIALASASGITSLIAIIWVSGNVTSGSFAIDGSNFADSTASSPAVVSQPITESSLLGSVGASSEKNNEAHIEIVSTGSSSTISEEEPERTVIPF